MAAEEQENNHGDKESGGSILQYSGLGMQIAIIIGGGSWLGSWLDEKYQTERSWFTLGLVLLSVTLAMVYAIKTLNRLNK